ncbi:MAG: hypothetical protein UU73_C0003G0290 [Candidatus Daviesbacteria bacterium GW2011_GWA1_41_61]|uniref:Uncharacterized protein n=1 Tax=Candidatus Daviesbacteria bacterium GW2011_GWA2_40_9 TaxID=1618424 RepID=A0A0G0U0L4_9BACT|nr:MAG: hypothetical protein UU26_C0018G0011 [Candidatus Daviesbacteria bacterium GW2011_GWC1_40_9]KKR82684.1 MAG: hypothetical protein UU29_C0010G0030 [Candidatus Daviesbacteria bacterium GW2011_GWA2_40_9]KKR93360.1 MAG: hypothetical protein UU44_C0002G0021 [Candidatus Daviesbacteria bacterium GW2011_GWB1_41_15]KKS15091.1 MAG: hypothetical protein UU73_C0003G0290 [Candidatus Daviesbacteria bacterium GW2011_GWA1_41_61]
MDTAQTDQELFEKEFNTNHILPINEMLGGDKEIPFFLDEWLKNGLNASAVYKTLHPKVSDASARVLGSKKLAKINISAILAGYDLGVNDYIVGLKEGLTAMKFNELTGEKVPDYRTRLEYHRILGKLLGF